MWEAIYQANTTPWRRPGINPAFSSWFPTNESLDGKKTLVPGCGTSLAPLAFAERGAQVSMIDVAPTAVAHQRGEFYSAGFAGEFICDDILSWNPPTAFDVVYEQTCLCAIRPPLRGEYAQKISSILKTGGLLYALFLQTSSRSGPPFHCDLSEMRTLFTTAEWDWLETEPIRSNHPIGVFELGYVLRRRRSQ